MDLKGQIIAIWLLLHCYFQIAIVAQEVQTSGQSVSVFRDPTTLPQGIYLQQFRERQEQTKNYVLNNTKQSIENAFLFAKEGLDVDFNNSVLKHVRRLENKVDPDFIIVKLLRLLQYTDEYDAIILPKLEKVPFWLTPGEAKRIYWSENHMIMYTSSLFLFREKYGAGFGHPSDPTNEERLRWWLEHKIDFGYYEYFSHSYMKHTTAALLNLYDFAKNEEIVALAEQALIRLLSDWTKCLNTFAFCFVFSGRDAVRNFGVNSLTYPTHQILELFSGFSKDYELSTDLHYTAVALSTTSFDPTPAIETFERSSYTSFRIGNRIEDDEAIYQGLSSQVDRNIAMMSSGGYAHPSFVKHTISLINDFELWENRFFKDYAFVREVPLSFLPLFTNAAGSLTKASITDIQNAIIWKDDAVTLASLENYFPGYKGYQQMTWMAAVGDASVFTVSANSKGIEMLSDVNMYDMNNQLPFVKQDQNLALIMYNPNDDLELLRVEHFDVIFHLDQNYFQTIVEKDNWLIGANGESYIAVYRHCPGIQLGQVNVLSACIDKQQVWAVMVGNKALYGSFEDFQDMVLHESLFEASVGLRCIYGHFAVDGKEVEHKFCRQLGNGFVFPAAAIVLLLVLFRSCCFLCKRRRKCRCITSRRVLPTAAAPAPADSDDYIELVRGERSESTFPAGFKCDSASKIRAETAETCMTGSTWTSDAAHLTLQ